VKPLACELGVFSDSERQRYGVLREELSAARRGAREVENGYTFRYPGDPQVFLELAEWITLERRCCPFLTFTVEFHSDGEIELTLSGDPNVKEFLNGIVAASARPG
jgi:hypothetical protein